jgi:TatD DNase family protein
MLDFHVHFSKQNKNSICSLDISECDKLPEMLFMFTLGVHPWFLKSKMAFYKFEKILNDIYSGEYGVNVYDNFIGLGECGLDRLKGPEMELQKKMFMNICRIGIDFDLPMVIHCVKAYPEILSVYKKYNNQLRWAVHSFSGNLVEAEKLINKNIFLSFGERLLSSRKLQKIFTEIPVNMIFLETDDADMTVTKLYEFGAELKGMNISSFTAQIQKNIFNFFAIL